MNREGKAQQDKQALGMSQSLTRYQEAQEKQSEGAEKMRYGRVAASDVTFRFEDTTAAGGETHTQISEALNAAFCRPRSKEFMDILKKQKISAMSDDEIRQIIAREIVRGGASDMEEVTQLNTFMESPDADLSAEPISEEEQALMEEMTEDDIMEFLEKLNAAFSEAVAKEEMALKQALVELDQRAIDESYHLTLCPITPAHDIHILPKNNRLFFCHLVRCKLSPVFEEAKKLLLSGAAYMVHVYRGCAFIVNKDGEVTKRIDVVEEPMNLVIRNGWEELP